MFLSICSTILNLNFKCLGSQGLIIGLLILQALLFENCTSYRNSASPAGPSSQSPQPATDSSTGTSDTIDPKAEASSFSLVVLPDIQYYALRYPATLTSQTRWIAKNKVKLNIVFTLFEGDLTHRNTDAEWKNVLTSVGYLEGKVDYSIAPPGNHDDQAFNGNSDGLRDTSKFNRYFPLSRYEDRKYFGGVFEAGKMDNSYFFFTGGGKDYMVLALEFAPRDRVLGWANAVVKDHSNRTVIIVTHGYLGNDNRRLKPGHKYSMLQFKGANNDGEDIWNKLVKRHKNISFVLSGHVGGDGLGRLISRGDHGNSVYQLLVNYQFYGEGGDGYLRIMKFIPAQAKLEITAYSPLLNKYREGGQDKFSIDLKTGEFVFPGNPLIHNDFKSKTRGDFNSDGVMDLAVGDHNANIESTLHAGSVSIKYGSAAGALKNLTLHQNILGVPGAVEEGDHFGYSMAVGDFNQDGFDDLAVGVPGEAIGNISQAGYVSVFFGSPAGLKTTKVQSFYLGKDNKEIKGELMAMDFYGYSLTANDFNGDGNDDLAVGIPGKTIAGLKRAGAVHVVYGGSAGFYPLAADETVKNALWHQNSSAIAGAAEAGDWFGYSLASGDLDGDGHYDLAVGVPNESIGSIRGAGGVNVIYGSSGQGLKSGSNQFLSQSKLGNGRSAWVDDHFGYSVAMGDLDRDGKADLAVGAPLEDRPTGVDAGVIYLFHGSANRSTSGKNKVVVFDNSYGCEASDTGKYFGVAVGIEDYDSDGFGDLIAGSTYGCYEPSRDLRAASLFYGSEQSSMFYAGTSPGGLSTGVNEHEADNFLNIINSQSNFTNAVRPFTASSEVRAAFQWAD